MEIVLSGIFMCIVVFVAVSLPISDEDLEYDPHFLNHE